MENPLGAKTEEKLKTPISNETREWVSSLDTELPINGEQDIPNFKAWVNWNGFLFDGESGHKGFDFAAYLRTDGKITLGLPRGTKVRAIADGQVSRITHGEFNYYNDVRLDHGNGSRPRIKKGK